MGAYGLGTWACALRRQFEGAQPARACEAVTHVTPVMAVDGRGRRVHAPRMAQPHRSTGAGQEMRPSDLRDQGLPGAKARIAGSQERSAG